MRKMIKYEEAVSDELDGQDLLACLRLQKGYDCGRFLPAMLGQPAKIQTFWETDGLDFGGWLPDGVSVCLVEEGLLDACRRYEAGQRPQEVRA